VATIGIDPGTSNSAATGLRGGRPVIIPSAEGVSLVGKAFPGHVTITREGQTRGGQPGGHHHGYKRMMGTREKIRLRDREFTPEQSSSLLLQKTRRGLVTGTGYDTPATEVCL
jgi:molecular chaperone DnaK